MCPLQPRAKRTFWAILLALLLLLCSAPAAFAVTHACSHVHCLFILDDGTLWASGENDQGQLGNGTRRGTNLAVQEISRSTDWMEVAAGDRFSLAIKNDGSLWSWGSNSFGGLGQGETITQFSVPTQLGTDTDWVYIAAGERNGVAIKENGTLFAWGDNIAGQLGNGTNDPSFTPIQIGTDTWTRVVPAGVRTSNATQQLYTVGLKQDGTFWYWGKTGGAGGTSSPVQVGTRSDWIYVDGGQELILAIDSTGLVHVDTASYTGGEWGRQVSQGTYTEAKVHSGLSFVGLRSDGSLWQESFRRFLSLLNQQSMTNLDVATPLQTFSTNKSFNSTFASAAIVTSNTDGSFSVGGGNIYGKLGIGSWSRGEYEPIETTAGFLWDSVSAGFYHAHGIRQDGTLWGWGDSNSYRLGTGDDRTDPQVPEQIGTDSDWSQVESGFRHSFGIKADGSLWGWGDNDNGQVGNNSTDQVQTPVEIDATRTWIAVSPGEYATSGLTDDGTLYTWGWEYHNGGGSTGDFLVPTQLGTTGEWAAVSTGQYHSVAIKKDGTLWTWGENYCGQLGTGDTTDADAPVQVGTDTDWQTATAGYEQTLAIKADGSLWGWGCNYSNELGLPDFGEEYNPVRVGNSTSWVSVDSHYYRSTGLQSDGSLWVWGYGDGGNLGDGNYYGASPTPMMLPDSEGWLDFSIGDLHSFGLRPDGTLFAWGLYQYGNLGLAEELMGSGATFPEASSLHGGITIPETSLDFGTLELGERTSRTFRIENNSVDETLSVSSIELPAGYNVENTCSSVTSGNFCDLEVFFEPSEAGEANGDVVVLGNLLGAGRIVEVTGTANAAPVEAPSPTPTDPDPTPTPEEIPGDCSDPAFNMDELLAKLEAFKELYGKLAKLKPVESDKQITRQMKKLRRRMNGRYDQITGSLNDMVDAYEQCPPSQPECSAVRVPKGEMLLNAKNMRQNFQELLDVVTFEVIRPQMDTKKRRRSQKLRKKALRSIRAIMTDIRNMPDEYSSCSQ